jgi:endoglucanase
MDRFIAVWLMLEDEFHADGEVIFELLNEVVNATAEQWNALAKRTVAALREKNKTRRIILGCTEWNNPPGLKDLCVLSDENVFYTFHCYAPHEFTHQRGVLQAQQLFYNREMPYPTEDIERYRDYHRVVNGNEHAYLHLDRMDKAFLYEYLAPVKEWIEKHPDKILWCGEFGTIRHAKLAWRENWMRDMISILNEWDIPYCVWNYLSTPNDGNRFSLVDDDTRELLGEGFKSILLGNG